MFEPQTWVIALVKQLRTISKQSLRLFVLCIKSKELLQCYGLLALYFLWKAQQTACTGKISAEGKQRLIEIRNRRRRELNEWNLASAGISRPLSRVRLDKHEGSKEAEKQPLVILSLDGGGIRGVITCVILDRICSRFPDFMDHVDLIAGASTGGYNALALASGWSPDEALQGYEIAGEQIFSNNKRRVVSGMGGMYRAKYGQSGKALALHLMFGERRLSDLRKHVVVPILRIGKNQTYKPVVVTNLPTLEEPASVDQRGRQTKAQKGVARSPDTQYENEAHDATIVDVLISTSAAPTYFPAYCGTLDGGLFANNPSLIALTKACEAGMATPRQLRILSISTGRRGEQVEKSVKAGYEDESMYQDWGLIQWAPGLVDMLMESSSSASDYACKQMLGRAYCRCDPVLPPSMPLGLDAVGARQQLVDFARQVDISDTLSWVEKNFYAKPLSNGAAERAM
jgi:patatin-like phospholipase/acyl hydrolase